MPCPKPNETKPNETAINTSIVFNNFNTGFVYTAQSIARQQARPYPRDRSSNAPTPDPNPDIIRPYPNP